MSEDAENDAIYTDFDAFLKSAILQFYERTGKREKGRFIALLVASGEIASLALDQVKSGAGLKKVAIGAVGVVALRIGLKYALSGPLGIILAAATGASLIAYFVKNRTEITDKIKSYRTLVADLRTSFEKLQSDHRDNRLDTEQRNLMADGLLQRFLTDLDA